MGVQEREKDGQLMFGGLPRQRAIQCVEETAEVLRLHTLQPEIGEAVVKRKRPQQGQTACN